MRIRLIASFFLLVLVTIGVFVIVTVWQNAQEVNNFVARGGLTGSEQVVSALERYYLANGTWEGIDEILRKSPHIPQRGIWSLQTGETRLWGSQSGRNQGQAAIDALSKMDLMLVDENGYLVAKTGDVPLPLGARLPRADLQRSVQLRVNGKIIGYLLRESGDVLTAASQISLLARLNRAAVYAVVVAGLVAIILVLILSYSLVRPVRALQTAASRLATGDLTQRVRVQGNDELADLGRTFNHMAESLEIAETSRRSMTADIAHELRNPLAVQRAHLEAIEDGVYPLTADSMNVIEDQNRLLTRLVEDLSMLALVDAGKLELRQILVDYPRLVKQVAARFQIQAAERKIDLYLSLDECPPMTVDAHRIEQILHNLFSNALRHTPTQGKIQCHVWVGTGSVMDRETSVLPSHIFAKDTCHLQIHDSGPGIPIESLPHIFDRFYRADKSRTRIEGGTGLGLSIARKLAQAHGGELTAANHPQGGAVFTLSLPVEKNF